MQPDGVSVTATGTQIQLITDVPSLNGDVLLVLGDGASDSMNSTYEEFCPNGLDSPECQVSLEACMKVGQKVIEKRIIPIIAGLAGVAVAGIVANYVQIQQHDKAIIKAPISKAPISMVIIPSGNLEKELAVQNSPTVVIATQSSGGNLLTVVPSPTGGYVYIS